ncbi:universal stress protein [Mucilaginibacter aquariorum]|uniref:Universal stress protein n=1 Tax=Mucilaginibacter aquariorum TaxID=2967225 RepID=A0ABT1T438_9SPHI|nr:universal stress protein [Mucilaginibacter aquariorum]MCQ6959233.1 universal stress protein [Mucilaginibacter aquariorum]
MKTILVISDHSPEAEHAALFALALARAVHADLLLATTVKAQQLTKGQPVLAGATTEDPDSSPMNRLCELNGQSDGYVPKISELDISAYPLDDLIAMINRKEIWLLVEGMPDQSPAGCVALKLNIQSVLNRVRCPLLLVPQSWANHLPERIAYLADLRYCRHQVLRYVGEVCAALDAGLTVAHLSARGLADIAEAYAEELFCKDVVPHTHHKKVVLNNIRERDLHKAVDVLVHGMQQDLLVFVNHRYHFEELIGRRIGDTLPADITVPVLIFPL